MSKGLRKKKGKIQGFIVSLEIKSLKQLFCDDNNNFDLSLFPERDLLTPYLLSHF